MDSQAVYINKIATAHAPFECHQQVTQYLGALMPPDSDMGKRLARVVAKLGIDKRYSVLEKTLSIKKDDGGFYCPGHFPSTEERMQVYAEKALPLASLALEPLLAGEDRQTITHLIVTSCTGFYAPGIDIDIINRFALCADVERTLIGFMGCYAAIPALKQAFHVVRSQPRAKVLVVNVELCSLHFRENAPLDQQLSFLLFADGAAASLISAKEQGLRLDSFYSAVLPNTYDLMGWTIGDQGYYMHLDEKIPMAIQNGLREYGHKVLDNIPVQQVASWAVHPGGRGILDAIESEWQLKEDALRFSRAVLKNNGNLSSATIMFVLEEIMRDPASIGRGCGMAFGPGLTLESFLYTLQ